MFLEGWWNCRVRLPVFSGELAWELMIIKGNNKSNAAPFLALPFLLQEQIIWVTPDEQILPNHPTNSLFFW